MILSKAYGEVDVIADKEMSMDNETTSIKISNQTQGNTRSSGLKTMNQRHKRSAHSYACVFREEIKQTKCKITVLIGKDGITKSTSNCKNKKKTSFTVKDYAALPINDECAGLRFTMDLTVKGQKANLLKVTWKPISQLLRECLPKAKPSKRKVPRSNNEASNWMKRVPDQMKINEMSIPGTHDSMAYKGVIPTIYVICQSIDLQNQLAHGVRFFDIRLAVKDGKLGAYHGDKGMLSFLDSFFSEIMHTFNQFLSSNPSEAIIFRYKKETEDGSESYFCSLFNTVIHKYNKIIWNYGKSGDKGSAYPKLEEIRGKIVIMRVNINCSGMNFDMKELDNYEGRETTEKNPFTNVPFVTPTQMVQSKVRSSRKKDMNTAKIRKILSSNDICNLTNTRRAQISSRNWFVEHIWEPVKENVVEPVMETFVEPVLEGAGEGIGELANWVLGGFFEASSAYKKELTDALDVANGNEFKNDLVMIWASAIVTHKLGPEGFAKDVNPHLRSYLKNDKYGRTGIVVFDFITDSDIPSIIYKKNWRGIGTSADWNFCSKSDPCSKGQGDCDYDNDCQGELICGENNCKDIHGNDAASLADCCHLPVGVGTSRDWNYCSIGWFKCGEGQGDCDKDYECKWGLRCGRNNCQSFFSKAASDADCCEKNIGEKPGDGSSADWNFCTSDKPCDLGYGDCDTDKDCKAGLRCGINNCRKWHKNAHHLADCCEKKPWSANLPNLAHLAQPLGWGF